MGNTVTGADAQELERVAAQLRAAATDLDADVSGLTAELRSVRWSGGVAAAFVSRWGAHHRSELTATAGQLRETATTLDANAADQRRASGGTGSRSAPGPGGSGPWEDGPTERIDDIDDIDDLVDLADLEGRLAVLGIGRTAVASIAKAAGSIDDRALRSVVDLLTNDRFAQLLRASGHFVDAGNFVVDVVADMGDHPELSFDERIVHALTDAATRLGLKEGIEHGAEFLAASLTSALIPVAGTLIAPIASQAAGAIAQMVFGPMVDQLDQATDFVDTTADGAVAIWRDVMATFGVLLDIAETSAEVVAGAIDLAGDAVDWLADSGGELVDGVADVVGGVGNLAGDIAGSAGGWLGL